MQRKHSTNQTTSPVTIPDFSISQESLPVWASFFSYQVTCCQTNVLWSIIVSVYKFSSLRILRGFYKPKSAVQEARAVFQSYTSLKVTGLVGMIYYSMCYVPKKLKERFMHGFPHPVLPGVGWLGTIALSQYSGNSKGHSWGLELPLMTNTSNRTPVPELTRMADCRPLIITLQNTDYRIRSLTISTVASSLR